MIKEGSENSQHSFGDECRHEDLSTLLQNINNIYEPQESLEDFVPTAHSPNYHETSTFQGPSSTPITFFLILRPLEFNQNKSVRAYNSLLGCPQSKSRLQVIICPSSD